MNSRKAEVDRITAETSIRLALDLDGPPAQTIHTNLPLFSHYFSALAKNTGWRIDLEAEGDVEVDPHHLVEDVGIALGHAVDQALGDRSGIGRYGQRWLPMDEALVLVVLDFSGRGQLYWQGAFPDRPVGGVSAEVWPEFFNGFARWANATLHVRCEAGVNAHHIYEAAFKGLGRALDEAVAKSGRAGIPSTKGTL